MLNMLESWKGQIEINGKQYDSIESARIENKTVSGQIHIKLLPKQLKDVGIDSEAFQTYRKCPSEHVVENSNEIEITVKKYMTEKSSPGFDFMAKWNNDVPMPLRTMKGAVIQETRGMVKMKLHGVGKAEICCMRCGRQLTNPISRHYGIGPECMQKIGFVGIDIGDVDTIKDKLQELTWTGWIIKSAITKEEEV